MKHPEPEPRKKMRLNNQALPVSVERDRHAVCVSVVHGDGSSFALKLDTPSARRLAIATLPRLLAAARWVLEAVGPVATASARAELRAAVWEAEGRT